MSALFTKEGFRVVPNTGELVEDHGWDTPNLVMAGMVFHGKRCLGQGFFDIMTGEEMIYKSHGKDTWRLKLPWAEDGGK